MILGVIILLGEAAAAYLVLDGMFRCMPVGNLQQSIHRSALIYGFIGAVSTATGAGLGWIWGGVSGFLIGLPGALFWWLFWRFGIQKQFGGR